MLKNLSSLVVLFAFTTLAALAQTPDGWQLFKSPAGDFKILLPANVHQKTENSTGAKAVMFQQIDASGTAYALGDGTYINPARKPEAQDEFVANTIAAVSARFMGDIKTPVDQEVSDVEGKGWHGKKIAFKTQGKTFFSVLVAFSGADDVAYTLYANAGDEKSNVTRFFKSFEVDPVIATKSHIDLSRSASVSSFVTIIWTLSLVVLVAAAIAIVVSIVRNRGQ